MLAGQLFDKPFHFKGEQGGGDGCGWQAGFGNDRIDGCLRIADGVVHAIGVCLGLIGAVTIVVIAIKMERIDVAPIVVYVIGLVTMLAFSAAYNMGPVSPAKWVLRRFDHSAIGPTRRF